jgi:hypothetical protein
VREGPERRKLQNVHTLDHDPVTVIGRYIVHDELASGGMASVHIGRLLGPVGFSRTVAIKILHPRYAKDPEFVAMFVDEARLAARIRHPNVVSTLDVVATDGQLVLVMEYVPGETLARLQSMFGRPIPPAIASAILVDVLDGLHAAHEARDEGDVPLDIVHRDVSPQNVMVGQDGAARVLDFGIAKAASQEHSTRNGAVKGKFPYMAPEQIARQKVDRRTDVFAAAVVLWEALTAERLFQADSPAAIVGRVMSDVCEAPSTLVPGLPPALDAIVLRGLSRDKDARFATAHEFARALETTVPPALRSEVRAWVEQTAHVVLTTRSKRIADIERGSASQAKLATTPDVLTTPGGPAVPVTHDTERAASGDHDGRHWLRRRARLAYGGSVVLATGVFLVVAFGRGPAKTDVAAGSAPVLPAPELGAPGELSAPSTDPVTTPIAPLAPGVRVLPRHLPQGRPRNRCDPPFTFSDAGVKRWKNACL